MPDGPPPAPVASKLRFRYAKRGRLRFTSHRDIARALERALRRSGLPVAYSAGFNPHPKVSWLGAAPTGTASEAEYVEIGLTTAVDPDSARAGLDGALPPGLDVVAAVVSSGGALAERIDASHWRIELPSTAVEVVAAAVERFLAADEVPVTKLTKSGRTTVDVRSAVVSMTVDSTSASGAGGVSERADAARYAILEVVVRHVTPAVRPDDVLTGLCAVAELAPPASVRTTRLAQGLLAAEGDLIDPFDADRDGYGTGVSPA